MLSWHDKAKIHSTILDYLHYISNIHIFEGPKMGQNGAVVKLQRTIRQTMLWRKIKGQLRDSTSRNFGKNKGQD